MRIETASSHGVHLHKVLSEDAQEVRLYASPRNAPQGARHRRALRQTLRGRAHQALEGLVHRTSYARNTSTRSGSALVGSKLKAAASPSTTTSNSTPTTPHNAPRPCASLAARSPSSMMTHPGVYLPAQQSNRLGRNHPVAHLLHPHRPRGGVPLTEIRTRSTPDLSPQADSRRRASVHHRDRLSARQVLRRRLRESGETASWTTLRRILEGQQRVTATFRRADGRTLHVRSATRAEARSAGDLRCLGRRLRSGRDPQEHRVEDRWRALVVPLARFRQRNCLM